MSFGILAADMHWPYCMLPAARALLLGAIVYCVPARALDPNRRLTQYIHRSWKSEQGLPELQIDSLAQTHDGYLWLGTYSGLVRFDGVRFMTITGPNRILDKTWIRTIVEDSQERLWLGTNDSGLIVLQEGVATPFSRAQGMPSDLVYCVLPTRQGDVWVCTGEGMARVSKGKVQTYEDGRGMAYAGCQTADGMVWAGSEDSRVKIWDGHAFHTRELNSVPPSTPVRSMLCAGDGVVWVGTIAGLIRIRNREERLFTTHDGLSSNQVLSLGQSRDGSLLIGTGNGLDRMRANEIETFLPEDGLSQKMVFAIHEDREGSLWAGTMHGLDQFLDGRSVPYRVREGMPSNNVGPVIEDETGKIWVGTRGQGVVRLDGNRFSRFHQSPPEADDILALLEDSGGVWSGSNAGLVFRRNGIVERTYTVREGLPSDVVRCIFRDRAGVLWVGTRAGPARLEHGRFVQPRPMQAALATPIMAMGEDRSGRLYIGTDSRGLFYFEQGKVQELWLNDGAPPRASAFYLDPDGLLWIATIGRGLKMIQDGKIASFSMKDGLFDTAIAGIAADAQDHLFLGCRKGIFVVSRSELLRFAAGSVRKLSATPIDPSRTIECNSGVQPAVTRAHDGRLWFSTSDGVIVFDLNYPAQKVPPPVVIESVAVNGESKPPAGIGTIAPGVKNLEFHYTGLSLLEPGRIMFRYILEGFDKEWIDAGTRREAFYTNLPPGPFRFRVTACNADGVCNQSGDAMQFTVAPYYYQKLWFLPLCAGLLALIAGLAHRLRVRRVREQLGLVMTERSRIARELHDTLIQGFSGITLQLQALAARLRSPEDREALHGIIEDAGIYLRETRQTVTSLRSEHPADRGLAGDITRFARQITADTSIRLKLRLSENLHDISAETQYNLLRIAQEAISNSVKHSEARNLEVTLDRSGGQITLSIKDDGCGLDSRVAEVVRPGHYGLIGMQERAAEIGGNLEVAGAPGKGTAITVLVATESTGRGVTARREGDHAR
jgi:ligand-binding sensor domain-containing protein/anti-sigma regulatory factor (Ser/Thr protein kinase)